MATQQAQREQLKDEVAAAEPAVARLPVAEPLADRIAQLQAGGNRALSRWLARQAGWASSPHAQNRGVGTYSGVKRIPVSGIASPGPGRALVLLSPGFTAGQCDVLVHMHGANVGYDDGVEPRDLNSSKDRIEEQLQLAARSQLAVVLPQGANASSYGSQLGRVNPREYSREALQKCVDAGELTSLPTINAVSLSGHSGGGFAIKQILDRPAQRNDLAGVAFFDAIQKNNASSSTSTGQIEAAQDLAAERITAEINALPSGATEAEKASRLRNGFQFVVYADANGGYSTNAGVIETFLQGIFGENGVPVPAGRSAVAALIAGLPGAARTALRARYRTHQVKRVTGGATHTANLGSRQIETTGHENMVGSNALYDFIQRSSFGVAPPTGAGSSTPATQPPATATPGATGELDLWQNDPEIALA